MRPIYKSVVLESAILAVSLSLQAEVNDGSDVTTVGVDASTLDGLRVELASPKVSGALDLIASGAAVVSGSTIAVTLGGFDELAALEQVTYRLTVKARYGTQVRTLYALDITVPRGTLAGGAQEYEDSFAVVSTFGDGGGSGGAQVVTYSELAAMRENAQLIAGAWYRITDFVTTVANKDNARSAGHAFDILVRALDSSTLDEDARAIQHAGDTYFAGCNLAAWELKYSLDNDTNRFAWADNTNGKGVVWFMRDEWNNSAFYDFKNVQFKRWAVSEIQDKSGSTLSDPTDTFAYNAGSQDIRYGYQGETYQNDGYKFVIEDSEDYEWYYAFTWINGDGEVEDATIVGQALLSDEDTLYGVHDNERGACYMQDPDVSDMMRDFDNGVEAATYTYEGGLFYGIYRTKTGNGCSYWTCGNGCYSWTCGNGCSSWTCGNDCYSWTCGNYCSSWTCGNYCSSWTCGNYCSSWTCGNGCSSWTCGNDCYSWTCGNYCSSWTCGNDCSSWTCGNGCYSWTCGNYCSSWTCGNYYRYFALEDGVEYVDISCAVTTGDSAYAQNILIHSGVRGVGDSNRATCEIATANNNFLTEFGTVVQGTIS